MNLPHLRIEEAMVEVAHDGEATTWACAASMGMYNKGYVTATPYAGIFEPTQDYGITEQL